jgi:hypothetical protein
MLDDAPSEQRQLSYRSDGASAIECSKGSAEWTLPKNEQHKHNHWITCRQPDRQMMPTFDKPHAFV